MIDFYFVELAKIVLSFLFTLLEVDAHITSALLPW